jgi:hypothetical protein
MGEEPDYTSGKPSKLSSSHASLFSLLAFLIGQPPSSSRPRSNIRGADSAISSQ